MTKLHLAPGLDLPVDVVTQKNAFLGRTGSGKTYGATKLAELLLQHDAQVVVLDPVGVWYGLRIGAEGKPGFKIPVFGGLHGDIPLQDTAGAMIADLIVDRGISAVLDVSQFETDTAKARFASAFAERFFFRKKAAPAPVHLFLEECQEFVPQNPQGGDAMMLHAFTRMAKLGRNFGIGISLISQRPQEINKKVLNMTEVMLAFQMRGPQERKTIREWSSDKDLSVDIESELPSLAVGECFVSSPQWLQVEKKVKIAKKITADVSSTPKVGEASRAARPLTPIDLEELQAKMAAAIELAKAEDPKELKKRIRELEGQLKKGIAPQHPKGAVDQGAVDRAVARAVADERKRQDRQRRVLQASVRNAIARMRRGATEIQEAADLLTAADTEIDQNWMPAIGGATGSLVGSGEPEKSPGNAPAVRHSVRDREVPREVATAEGVSRPQQRMLNALATLKALGVDPVKRNIVAALSNQSPRSSGWDKNCSTLRTKALISYPSSETMALTAAGERVAEADDTITSTADVHAAWKDIVSGPQWRMLEQLIGVYPDAMDRNALAAASSQSSSSSGWDKNLSTLRSLGLIDYPSTSEAVATDLLFPRGLR